MSRFISIHNMMINVDHIVRILEQDEDTRIIYLSTGEKVEAHGDLDLDIMGHNHIVDIVPCNDNLWARMEQDGKEFDVAVEHLVLTADGSYYPLEAALLEEVSEGEVIYKALVSDDGDDDEEFLCMNSEDESAGQCHGCFDI